MKWLIISYYFPPQTSVGVFRTTGFLDNFKDNDLDAVILTVQHPDKQFHPYKDEMPATDKYNGFPVYRIKDSAGKWRWQLPTRAIKFAKRLLGKPVNEAEIAAKFWHIDMQSSWIKPATAKALELIKKHDIEGVYVTCPPFSHGEIGKAIKEKTGLPLVLDFRDGWVSSSSYLDDKVLKYQAIEHNMVKASDAMTVTSESDQANYSKLRDNVHLIHNGYDAPFDQKITSTLTKDDPLTILYLGAWGVFERSPDNLLEALSQCDFPWKLISVGGTNDLVEKAAKTHGVTDKIECLATRPKSELLPIMERSDALFIIKGNTIDNKADTHIAAKTFDYLAIGMPVLGQLPHGDTANMIEKYCDQAFISPPSDVKLLKVELEKLAKAKQAGKLVAKQNMTFLKAFHRKSLTQKLKKAFESV